MEALDYRWLIREAFDERRRRNPNYSLTAFSRWLGMSVATLSQILSGKRPLSRKAAHKIVEKCHFDTAKRRVFLESAFGGPSIPDAPLIVETDVVVLGKSQALLIVDQFKMRLMESVVDDSALRLTLQCSLVPRPS